MSADRVTCKFSVCMSVFGKKVSIFYSIPGLIKERMNSKNKGKFGAGKKEKESLEGAKNSYYKVYYEKRKRIRSGTGGEGG